MPDELEEHLRNHAQSFNGLLSLIPAKLYYGEDVSDQWKRKKQTPEQKRAAKIAKLNPDNWKSAKDVMDERSDAVKRKRLEKENREALGTEQVVPLEQPKSMQDDENHKAKKRKLDVPSRLSHPIAPLTAEEKKQKKDEKKATKREKAQKQKDKLQRQKDRKKAAKVQNEQGSKMRNENGGLAESISIDTEMIDGSREVDQWSTASASDDAPDVFSPPAQSGTSSISSLPPSITDQPVQQKSSVSKQKFELPPKASIPQNTETQPRNESLTKPPTVHHEAARARLANAISSFRSARKADEPASNKPRNRAELLEQRRRKEEAKREAKKEQRRKEREEAARKEDEEIAKRFSPGGSGSLLGSPRSPPMKEGDIGCNSFSYGRLEFSDGTKVDSTHLNGVLDPRKKKGPQDSQTALKAAQGKASRLAGLDEQKRKDIEEKDMWLNAKRRAHGERVKDDTSLLKKALKRQESQKKKSEKEWTDRKDGIMKAQEAKQKKRTENLAKRKEDKLAHKVGKKGKKVKKRPGFEGSFRGRTGGGKKK